MLQPGIDRRPLPTRMAALRRRLRLVVTVRGLGWFLAILLLAGALGGLLDWRVHLPGFVRAILLVGTLAGAGLVALRYLIVPLAERADDFALALRIEERYPFLNDCLASTVQFLERAARREPVDETQGSPSLRRETVERTLRQIQVCDFSRVVNSAGVGWAGASVSAALALACILICLNPALAFTALERLAVPFGGKEWPRQTRLQIQAAKRLARGAPFEIRGTITGVIPDDAVVFFEGLTPSRQVYSVRRDSKDHARGLLVARVDRVDKPFRFQVHANDAVTPWHDVAVEPPPMLVPWDGRPSPLVQLHYPSFTDLADRDLPDSSGNVDAVVGTQVTLRAAADRPLARAWIEYRPEQPHLPFLAALSLFGAPDRANFAALFAGAHDVTAAIPAEFAADRQRFTIRFLPRVRGMYALRFEDDTGLSNLRLFDLRLFPDPAPTVNLERPSPAHDGLEMLPDAEITVQVTADDPQFALRSVYLTYRCQPAEPPQVWPLYDHKTLGASLAQLSRGLMGERVGSKAPPLRLRPQHLSLAARLSLSAVKHHDGRPLRAGDVVVLQACADDFDDVAVDKQPGRSHEVALRIVDRAALDQILSQEQTKVQEELLRLRKSQQEALERVIGAEQRWRNTGKLRPQEVDQLLQAEQLQQQIRTRVGTKQEGLRADVERILSTLRDNRLPRSGTHDRLESVAAELDRLARENLDQIEPRLTNARKENELASQPPASAGGVSKPPPKNAKSELGEARQHQEEVESTLAELLKQLEPWGNLSALKGEARAILQEQRGLNDQVHKLDRDETRGKDPDNLAPAEKATLGRAAELQRKLAERAGQLVDEMKRAGDRRDSTDPAMAEALREAAARGEQANVQEQLKNAAANIRQNNLGNADRDQKAGIQGLESMVQALEERREQELDRLRKKLQQTQDKVKDLMERQQELRKKMKDAAQIADRQKRRQELKRLAREQERLREETQELLKELTRLRADSAGQSLSEAANQMDRAAQQLERGEDAQEPQDETLDRLNDVQQRLEQTQRRVEEELAREKLAKIADQLQQLKQRQEAVAAEAARIQQQVEQRNQWSRSALINLRNLSEAEKALAQETDGLAKGKLAGAPVFARILSRAAQAMQQASQRMLDRVDRVAEHPDDTKPDRNLERLQREAVRRLDQLGDALKNDTGIGSAPTPQDQPQPGSGDAPNAGGTAPSDGISYLAQLKALRSLQQEVNDRTSDFSRKHPDRDQLSKDEQQELAKLQKDQQEVADLLEDLLAPAAREGARK